jgi:hypothetical protein
MHTVVGTAMVVYIVVLGKEVVVLGKVEVGTVAGKEGVDTVLVGKVEEGTVAGKVGVGTVEDIGQTNFV